MAKTNKVGEGLYRTEDGLYQISQNGDEFLVAERRKNRYVVVATASTKAAADKELNRVSKTDEELPEVEVAPVEEVVEEA